MGKTRICILVLTLFGIGLPVLSAQQAGRSSKAEEAERDARELFGTGDYDKAVSYLERATQDNPQDLSLLSLLGMAYLYSSSRVDSAMNFAKAQPIMEKAIDAGGQAIFLVGKAEDKLKEAFVIKAVMGELRIGKDSMSFMPSRGSNEGTGPISKADVKECGLNRRYGKDSSTFHIKTARANFDFRPLHFSKEEANLACTLAAKYFGAKVGN